MGNWPFSTPVYIVVMMLIVEQSGQNLKMECGTAQSALIKTRPRHSSVPCVMFGKERLLGKQMLLVCVFFIYNIFDYAVCI